MIIKRVIAVLILSGLISITPLYLLAQYQDSTKVVFEPGLISTSNVEYGGSFTRNRSEIYFVRTNEPWGTAGKSTIYYSKLTDGRWSEPEIAFFSGKNDDSDPYISQDGNRLFFISDRQHKEDKTSADIWLIQKRKDGSWSEPQRLPEPVNSAGTEYSPRTDGHGNLYFASDRPGGFGQGDLYMSEFEHGTYQNPVNLGSTINSVQGEWNLDITDKGDILIFEASGRKENVSGYGDLYLSFKKDHQWSIPENIHELNTSGSDLYPQLFLKQKLLFYSSSDSLSSKITNIYFSPIGEILEEYREKAVYPMD